jgi:hypothetical protein
MFAARARYYALAACVFVLLPVQACAERGSEVDEPAATKSAAIAVIERSVEDTVREYLIARQEVDAPRICELESESYQEQYRESGITCVGFRALSGEPGEFTDIDARLVGLAGGTVRALVAYDYSYLTPVGGFEKYVCTAVPYELVLEDDRWKIDSYAYVATESDCLVEEIFSPILEQDIENLVADYLKALETGDLRQACALGSGDHNPEECVESYRRSLLGSRFAFHGVTVRLVEAEDDFARAVVSYTLTLADEALDCRDLSWELLREDGRWTVDRVPDLLGRVGTACPSAKDGG